MDRDATTPASPLAHVDLHCHTIASFDSVADPLAVVAAASARGLTHLAITDHDTLDGALRARDAAPPGLTVIVGQECRTSDGDLICLFVDRLIAPGRPAMETVLDARSQGAVVGIPHPFDRARNSILTGRGLLELGDVVDYVEVFNARLVGSGNEQATRYAAARRLPGVAVSDAHSILEVGIVFTALRGELSTPAEFRAGLEEVGPIAAMGQSGIEQPRTAVGRLVGKVRARWWSGVRRDGGNDSAGG